MHLSNFAFSHLGHELCALGTWYNNSNEKKFDNIILNWKRRVLLCWATRVIERQSFHISMRRRRNILYEINSYSMSFRLWKSVFWDCKKFFILAYNILFTVIFRFLHHGDNYITTHFFTVVIWFWLLIFFCILSNWNDKCSSKWHSCSCVVPHMCTITNFAMLWTPTITSNVDELHKNSHPIYRHVISYRIEI